MGLDKYRWKISHFEISWCLHGDDVGDLVGAVGEPMSVDVGDWPETCIRGKALS